MAVLSGVLFSSAPVGAQEQLLFPAVENAHRVLLEKIRNEQVRLDVAVWLLADGDIVREIISKHQSGVPVRLLGDRVSIFEGDPNTRASFIQLATAGVPIRLRYHPTSFPEIMHWKSAIFVGQHLVEFGSANFTTFELAPWSRSNFKDETVLFSDDLALVRAFMTKFDRMWANTTQFLNWPAAYQRETGTVWPHAMRISTARLAPDYSTSVPGMIWSQGTELLNRMIAEIDAETRGIDLVSYRLTVPGVTDALIRRHRAGVPVRVFIEPTQYRNPSYPEYWLVGAMADKLWAAGVPIKQRTHDGLTHMKTLVTSRVAMVGSSNFTRFWERDHNYFADVSTKPAIYMGMKARFDAMWNDAANYRPFQPLRPGFVQLQAPASGATNVATSSALTWKRTPWAVAFDVYMGGNAANLAPVGRVNAVVTEHPPETYSFVPPQRLQPSTRYYWRVVARTFATDVNPGLTTASEIFTFVTDAVGIVGDADADGKADPVLFRPSSGDWMFRYSTANFASGPNLPFGASTDKPVPGDYDGDGRSDMAVYRPSTGIWYVIYSSTQVQTALQWGISTDVPMPADYTGDGRTDLAVWRPATGMWFIYDLATSTYTSRQWGISSDRPLTGDFDADGKADVAVFRPTNGYWYVYFSRSQTYEAHQWGNSSDVPVAADYTGDGRVDLAVYRRSTGFWYVLNLVDGTTRAYQWGAAGDIPVPKDYDGDRRADLAVWRPSTATWWIYFLGTATYRSIGHGTSGDIPIR